MRVLVIGINIRHIAGSASRAGHEVFAVDCYCDVDLARWAKETAKMPREGAEEQISYFIKKFRPDAVVLGPGLEEASVQGVPVLNNLPEKTAQVSDKLWLARWLEEKGFPFIKTQLSAEDLHFPFLVKPRKGAGGVGCRVVNTPSELKWEEGMIAQERINGLPASVSVIGNGRAARAIAVNEQLIGVPWAGAKGFRYSGNITPLAAPQCAVAQMAEEIIASLGLVGSNGVDFLLTENGPVVVEVNSRFQGSLDTVEMSGGDNVFQAHLQSFLGMLPERPAPSRRTAGRIIIYAPRDLAIEADLVRDWTRDVPGKGSRIAADDPVLSIMATGPRRDAVMAKLKTRAATLGEIIKVKLDYQDTTR
ncbi:MAG: ATP-grasp domain-containing protein [Methanothrix sp.]|nr:ATP-grasp domain-containing protein [Methanothrix sp.]